MLCIIGVSLSILTHHPKQNGRHLADDIFRCIFLNENEKLVFRSKCHWSLFLRSNWQLPSICLDNGLAPNRRQTIIWNNADPNHWRICVVIGRDELNRTFLIYNGWRYSMRFDHNGTRNPVLFVNCYCPACRTTLIATRFRVAVICPIIQVPHCIRVFFYFVWFVFINHIFQFYNELCTYCNILDIYLS